MTEHKELSDAIHKVELTMARIEGKLDTALELKTEVTELRKEIASTDDTARSAEAKADANAREIESIKSNQRWAVGIIAPILAGVLISIIGIVFR